MSWVKKGINHLVLLAIGLIWVYPFLWMISASFKSQNEFRLDSTISDIG